MEFIVRPVRSRKAAGILLAVMVCVILTGGWAYAQQAAGLSAVGGVDPANGYPKWYIDGNGLQLAPCLDTTVADPCGLLAGAAIPNPAAPISFPTNFPDEVFYLRLTAKITGIGGGSGVATLGNALEGAFGGPTGTAADGAGAQIVFARFRFRVTGGLVSGATYTMTGPLGTQSFDRRAGGDADGDGGACGAADRSPGWRRHVQGRRDHDRNGDTGCHRPRVDRRLDARNRQSFPHRRIRRQSRFPGQHLRRGDAGREC